MKRKELLELMPKNKSDSKAAEAIVRMGYPVVSPVLRDMLLWLRVANSSVADIFAAFFAQLRPPAVELIGKHLGTKSEFLRNRILVDILQKWPRETVQQLAANLTALATHPDVFNNDIECFRLLLKHDLADEKWMNEWVRFRKEQAADRLALFTQLEEIIK